MEGYICMKAITLGGIVYQKGEAIPKEAILPKRVRALAAEGYIAEQRNTADVPTDTERHEPVKRESIPLPITKNGAEMELAADVAELREAVTILQKSAEEAIKDISAVEREGVLILVDALDSRKTVKAAAAARAGELNKRNKEARAGEKN